MPAGTHIGYLALELTGRCQMRCRHCFADSSPYGGHGSMTGADWRQVLDAAADYGVAGVQFIGGEPTLHPECADLVTYALAAGLRVEVFTNLVRVSRFWWALFRQPDVSVATSYYTDDAAVHDAFTGLSGSHARTRSNIAEAVRAGVRIRVSIVDIGASGAARADLIALGVTNVKIAPVQQIGRSAAPGRPPSTADLCGRCAQGRAAVDPNGDVLPCVMARWLPIGNVHRDPLAEILTGQRIASIAAALRAEFGNPSEGTDCPPDPQSCSPDPQTYLP